MALVNCKRCGKMFNHAFGPMICEPCKKKEEEDFQRTKEYINENPAASMNQISEEAGVTTSQLQKWITEERLMFAENSPIKITCKNCGARILTGQYCEKCKGETKQGLIGLDNANKARLQAEAAARELALMEQRKGKMHINL